MSDLRSAFLQARGRELKVGTIDLHTIRRGSVEFVALLQLFRLARCWGIHTYELYDALRDTKQSRDVHITDGELFYLETIGASGDYSSLETAMIRVDELVPWCQKVDMPHAVVAELKAAIAQHSKQEDSTKDS